MALGFLESGEEIKAHRGLGVQWGEVRTPSTAEKL